MLFSLHRLPQDSESCSSQLNHIFTAVVDESMAGVIFIHFTKTKVKKEQHSPDSYNKQRPQRATIEAAKQREMIQKKMQR